MRGEPRGVFPPPVAPRFPTLRSWRPPRAMLPPRPRVRLQSQSRQRLLQTDESHDRSALRPVANRKPRFPTLQVVTTTSGCFSRDGPCQAQRNILNCSEFNSDLNRSHAGGDAFDQEAAAGLSRRRRVSVRRILLLKFRADPRYCSSAILLRSSSSIR